MSRSTCLVLAAALAVVAAPAFAGGAECQQAAAAHAAHAHAAKKCDMSAAECKEHMAAARTRGWLGIEFEQDAAGASVVTRVVPGSPAAQAGFREGDVLVALNGIALEAANHDRLTEIRKGQKAGDAVSYDVRRDGTAQRLEAHLGQMPDEVYEAWVAEHMKEHADVASR